MIGTESRVNTRIRRIYRTDWRPWRGLADRDKKRALHDVAMGACYRIIGLFEREKRTPYYYYNAMISRESRATIVED